jgi:hypothetical protein
MYTGVDAREWCKRMKQTLGAILDPLGTGLGAHTAAGAAAAVGGPAFAIAPPAPTSAAGAKAAQLPGGYNAVAGFSALGFGGGSSSDDSDDDSELNRMTREQRLQRKLGLDGKKASKRVSKAAGKPDRGSHMLQTSHLRTLTAYSFECLVSVDMICLVSVDMISGVTQLTLCLFCLWKHH